MYRTVAVERLGFDVVSTEDGPTLRDGYDKCGVPVWASPARGMFFVYGDQWEVHRCAVRVGGVVLSIHEAWTLGYLALVVDMRTAELRAGMWGMPLGGTAYR